VSEPVDPIRRLARAARAKRVGGGAASGGTTAPGRVGRALTPMQAPRAHEPEPPAPQGDAAFAAQLLGGTPRRGLKGGREMLQQARTTYLETEYSGDADRRAKKGRETKTEV
jgi:hypothetical protein